MNPLLERPARCVRFVAMDFETTGSVRGWEVEPWQFGMIDLAEGRIRPETAFESWLRIDADRPFNPYAPGRHGQVRDRLAAAPSLAELYGTLATRFAGAVLVAHNVGTERTLLAKAFPLHRLGPWVDTLKLVRNFHPELPGGSLGQVLESLGLRPRVDAACPGRTCHDALYDAVACAVLLEYFLGLPGWESVPVQALL
ncbi:MAG: exonuclease domain-containing protein [Kiritimatiellia bacterium]|jgi:DNA polymerase III epsilon subunit-like protein